MNKALSSMLLISLFACKSRGESYVKSGATITALNPMDISFILPIPDQNIGFPISVASADHGGSLLTEDQYDALRAFVPEGGVATFGRPPPPYLYPKFHVIGFRFDPCPEIVPIDLDLDKCSPPLIRLVAQAIENEKVRDMARRWMFYNL